MGLFDWVGRAKREEEWMAQPRRLPSGVDKIEDGDPSWIMSHEFANDKNKNIRIYLAARKHGESDKMWTISMYKTDLKHDGQTIYSEYDTDVTADPMDVVRALSDFDRKYRNSDDWVPIEGHRGTYRPFANKYGIHFDDEGKIMKVEQDTRVVRGTFMNKETLDELFHKAVVKTPEIDTWEEIYAQLAGKWPEAWTVTEEKLIPAKVLEPVKQDLPKEGEVKAQPAAENASTAETPKTVVEENKADVTKPAETPAVTPVAPEAPIEPKFEKVTVTRPVTLEDLSKHVIYSQFAWEAKQLMEKLKKLPADLRSNTLSRQHKEQLINSLAEAYYHHADLNIAEVKLAQRLRDTTIVVGLLRAGAELYEDFAKGKFSPDTMSLMSHLGKTAGGLAKNRLGVDDKSAQKIPDIIAKGKDPNTNLPLENTLTAYPAGDYTPPAPKPAPKQQPQPPKKKPSSNWWD